MRCFLLEVSRESVGNWMTKSIADDILPSYQLPLFLRKIQQNIIISSIPCLSSACLRASKSQSVKTASAVQETVDRTQATIPATRSVFSSIILPSVLQRLPPRRTRPLQQQSGSKLSSLGVEQDGAAVVEEDARKQLAGPISLKSQGDVSVDIGDTKVKQINIESPDVLFTAQHALDALEPLPLITIISTSTGERGREIEARRRQITTQPRRRNWNYNVYDMSLCHLKLCYRQSDCPSRSAVMPIIRPIA
ncbi:uncharacterized protein BP01DRAFT_222727 [Aspergillus saccharolyticus JOP 1030-1]|uniref:Uncharacterized protein n=1 Tax=Aspergillus saccharolyticus JOP 1030-1 TaxID=1450539 RepID=A0A318ZY76_9EURO|nr:hypothetical protein BP01DRAFT_222727 [Aspergillus saccharolyticus JOP 1030-1]PYH40342.1 hypothetical protein BP01DRAFT_222727 [Aspergillus saccharolyticus JOP 1030-1]